MIIKAQFSPALASSPGKFGLPNRCFWSDSACPVSVYRVLGNRTTSDSSVYAPVIWQRHFLVWLKPDLLKAIQESLESSAVLSWGDEGGFFVAITVDLKKVLGRKGFVIHFLAKLKRNNGILTAVDD